MGESDADQTARDLARARALLIIVALGLFVSGVTCYFLPWEARAAARVLRAVPLMTHEYKLLLKVEQGLQMLSRDFPEFMLATDWLGFAHIILAILFIGAARDPVRNIWVVRFGMISAVMVVPAAWLFGSLRGLPAIHYFVDASFGVGSMVFLCPAYQLIRKYA